MLSDMGIVSYLGTQQIVWFYVRVYNYNYTDYIFC